MYDPVFSKVSSYRGMRVADIADPALRPPSYDDWYERYAYAGSEGAAPLAPAAAAVAAINAQDGTQADLAAFKALAKDKIAEYQLSRMSWSERSNFSAYLSGWIQQYRGAYKLDLPYLDVLGFSVFAPDFNTAAGPAGFGRQVPLIEAFLAALDLEGFEFEGYTDVYAAAGGGGLLSGSREPYWNSDPKGWHGYHQAPEVIRATFPHHRLFEGSANGQWTVPLFHTSIGFAFVDGNSFDLTTTMPDALPIAALREAARPLTDRAEYLFRTGVVALSDGWVARAFAEDAPACSYVLWTFFDNSTSAAVTAEMTLSTQSVAAVFPPAAAALGAAGSGQRWFVVQDDGAARRVAACDGLATCAYIAVASRTGLVLATTAAHQPLVTVRVASASAGAAATFAFAAVGGAAGRGVALDLVDYDDGSFLGGGNLSFAADGTATRTLDVTVAGRELPRRVLVDVGSDPSDTPPRRRLAMVPVVDPSFHLRPHSNFVVPHPNPTAENVLALMASYLEGQYTAAYRRLYWPRGAAATVYVRWLQKPENATHETTLQIIICDPSRKTSAAAGATPYGIFTGTNRAGGTWVSSFNVTGPPDTYWKVYYGALRGTDGGGRIYTDRLAVIPAGSPQRPPWWDSAPPQTLHPSPFHSEGSC